MMFDRWLSEKPPLEQSAFSERAALALAEAILPGSSTLPAADEATVAAAERLVESTSPRLARAWRIAQATLSSAAVLQTGRPFHALSAEAQESLLHQWERDPALRVPLAVVGLVYKFVHCDRRPVYETMGGKLNVVTSVAEPRWLDQVHRAEAWPEGEDIECEVVVIGTGAGGAVVGRELAERGFAVVFLEEGEHYRRNAFDGSSVRAHQRFYRPAMSVGNVVMPVFMGRLVGGSTAINGGTCFRTPPWILERWCEDLRTDSFSSSAMEPYFERVERTLGVAPSPRRTIGPIADVMARGCDALGWNHFPIPRNAPGCDGSGFCDFGCRNEARRGTDLAYLPPALERGGVLLTGLRADEIILENGAAAGVVGCDRQGRKIRIRARAVVLAGGAIPTPLLLLKQGLCASSGQVGRNLSVHPSSALSAVFDDAIRPQRHVPQGYACDQFVRDGILMLAAQPDVNIAWVLFPFTGHRFMDALSQLDHVASFGLMIRDASRNGRVWREVSGLPAITYNVTRDDVAQMHRAMVHAGEMALAAGAKRLYPVALKHGILDGEREFRRFRDAELSPSDIVWTSYHPLGSCAMGRDPRTSVVGLDHETHDVPGLFITDGSTVPGPIGVNPQITIMAMATRAADRIAAKLS
jgi:choline dehydrogenase-like flavoprotein